MADAKQLVTMKVPLDVLNAFDQWATGQGKTRTTAVIDLMRKRVGLPASNGKPALRGAARAKAGKK